MSLDRTASDDGGWKYNEIPRTEFYEALEAVLEEFSDYLMDDPVAARKLEQDPYNDFFYCGFGGEEDAFRVSLWPADLPTLELYENGEIGAEEYRAQCWPKTNCQPVTVYLGDADTVIELAEDEESVRQLADSLAEFAGIVLVDDWDPGDDEPGGEAGAG